MTTVFVPLALWGFIPVVLLLFAVLPARRALIVGAILGFLFLPEASFRFERIPDYTKASAISYALLLGAMLLDPSRRLFAFRPRLFDLPALLLCITPFFTSISNSLGAWDGIAESINATARWGIPYLLARAYLDDLDGLRELCIGLVIGGLVYLPFCVWEIRMSPHLNKVLYGFFPAQFAQAKRLGGYRPMVFLTHGLAVGMWMSFATISAAWLWQTGTLKRLFYVPMSAIAGGLFVVSILCRSSAAILLLLVGVASLMVVKWTRLKTPLIVLLCVAPIYVGLRSTTMWDGAEAVEAAAAVFGEDRAASIDFRLRNEVMLRDRALERPLLGWGGWGRTRVVREDGSWSGITDGLWILIMGRHGLLGLTALMFFFLFPVAYVLRRVPVSVLCRPAGACLVIVSTMLILHMIDNLLNAMLSPVYIMATGALTNIAIDLHRARHMKTKRKRVTVSKPRSVQPAVSQA